MQFRRTILLFLTIMFFSSLSLAKEPAKIPEPLKPWVDWVLHDHEEQFLCIPQYNDSARLRCQWPTELRINVHDRGGRFEQEWLIHYESWIVLPGGDHVWPENVKVNGKPAIVLNKDTLPGIKVPKGRHTITGEFHWNSLPEHLQVPPASALLNLSMNGRPTDFPNIDNQGRLWLHRIEQKEEKIENRLNIQSFRLIDDMIPPRIVLTLNLDVAGSAREILIGPSFSPEKFIPLSLTSSLPARVEQDGRIRMQIRPGQWSLTLVLRHIGPISTFPFHKPDDGFWPDEEIWVYSARTNLRIVEIDGVPSIDPQQTTLPEKWRNYPAYRVVSGDTMRFKEMKRGDPVPAPDQLTLQRNLWLRFDGKGYTIQDRISGKKNNDWRLEMNSPIELGRVAVDGIEQFITTREGSDRAGIELRKGQIEITADSEYQGDLSTVPVAGWEHDFQKVNTQLHLPPGYRILYASGMDNVPVTWITRWTLLDLFVVLIFTIAVAKLLSIRLAVISFITMVLLYHEPGAPRWIWLAILAGIALLRNLPEGRFRTSVKLYQLLVTVSLIALAVPFAIKALRVGIYPQLEKPRVSMIASYPVRQVPAKTPKAVRSQSAGESETPEERRYEEYNYLENKVSGLLKGKGRSKDSSSRGRSRIVEQYDPSMINQTGPGLPSWQWNRVHMNSGPVQRGQQISLMLIGPTINLVLSFLRVGFLIVLALGMFGIKRQKGGGWHCPNIKNFLLIPLFLFSLLIPEDSRAGEIPSPQLFDQLQKRLLEKDDCFPSCADVRNMEINITPDNLEVIINVHSQIDTTVPLPGDTRHWRPQGVLIDRQRSNALYKVDNGLWTLVPAGKHEIVIKGVLPKYNTINLPLPLKPHRVEITQKGWTSEGIHQDGTIENQIQFKRITEEKDTERQILDSGELPQFAFIERTLLLGLDWKVETRVERIGPTGSAMVLTIPLLPGESVITGGVQVANGLAQISLDAQTRQIRWESVLDKADEIILKHSETDQWTEIWHVDVSPVFHMEYDGIPVILHKTGNRWSPKWHPWPGEEVTLKISRPAGVEGQTLTIDKSHLEVRPGQRVTDCKLTLSIRSSQGGQHTITLPGNSQLQEVSIGGKLQPIRQEGRNVPLPITPGKQDVLLQWRGQEGISIHYKTPEIDLGIQNVNANIDVYLPHNRWPLFLWGPRLGPAILFWSVVIVITLVAFGLSRTGLTPLKLRHWFLLGIGMSQSGFAMSIIVVGWLIAFHFRAQAAPDMKKRSFNAMQAGLAFLTFLALGSLIAAISQGLLGHPDMNIAGNGSGSGILRWYQDMSIEKVPQSGIVSIPMIHYRLAMLAWALWISFSLIKILKWGWGNYSKPALWHNVPKKNKPGKKINVIKDDSKDIS